jgi:hypothetical protein
MVQDKKQRGSGSGPHLFEWVEDKLRPVFEPPPPGRYDAAETVNITVCPVCGHSMREHTIDHSSSNTILNCPVPSDGLLDRDAFEPVNEFGMVMRTNGESSGHR